MRRDTITIKGDAVKDNRKYCVDCLREILICMMLCLLTVSCSRAGSYPAAPVSGTEVVIDAQFLPPGVPRFLSYRYNNRNINFFVIKINNKVLSFFDACLSCNPKLGFSFEQGFFTCKVCGTRYSVAEVERGLGGCFPVRLPGELRGGRYYIPVSHFGKYASSL